MSNNFRYPNITGQTTESQLRQIQGFLYQHIQQLNWAMQNIGTGGSGGAGSATARNAGGAGGDTQSNQQVFNGIKSLIIKSADIINAYYEEISSRLSGEYVAKSDFGAYQETTSQEIEANSTSIEQIYANMQVISDTVDGLYDSTIQTNAYIKTGLLYYREDGAPVYGMEIGQSNTVNGEQIFDKFARFTSGRLSFYDNNDAEIAYISDYKLYITNAHITGSLIVGGYEMDTSDGLAFDWIGGM